MPKAIFPAASSNITKEVFVSYDEPLSAAKRRCRSGGVEIEKKKVEPKLYQRPIT